MKRLFFTVLALMCFATFTSNASQSAPAVNADNKDSFATVSEWVRSQMKEGGRYAFVNAIERNTVNSHLDEMGKLFDKQGSTAQMTSEEQKKLLVSQQEINDILAKRDTERLVCKLEKPVGSNIPVKTCRTAGEIANNRREDQDFLRRREASPQLRSGH